MLPYLSCIWWMWNAVDNKFGQEVSERMYNGMWTGKKVTIQIGWFSYNFAEKMLARENY